MEGGSTACALIVPMYIRSNVYYIYTRAHPKNEHNSFSEWLMFYYHSGGKTMTDRSVTLISQGDG